MGSIVREHWFLYETEEGGTFIIAGGMDVTREHSFLFEPQGSGVSKYF